ncbi:MAG: hypothetical protein U1C57_02070 [Candidatus Doudnabacteria bacterium]|nr:hypothetical protein [Candidatus Doudnabacteria bacterium]
MVEIPQLRWLFSNTVKGGLTVFISVLVIYGVVHAGTITPPSGTPAAQFYSLSEIYNFITANTTATEGSPALDWSAALEGTGRTLTEIYDALASLISADKVKSGTTYLNVAGTLVPSGGTATTSDVLSGKTYFGDSQTDWTLQTGTMANNGAFALTASSSDQSVTAGYYSGGTLAGDADLVAGNISNGVNIFGVIGNLIAGYLYGSSDASQVLTSAGAGAGTYNVSNLSNSVIKRDTTWGVSLGSTGTYSGYPGTAWSGTAITQAACDAQNPTWYWFEDGNGDGDTTDPEDGVCVRATPVTSLSWNGAEQIAVATSLTNQTATDGSATTISATGVFGTTNYANMVVRFPTGATAPTCWGVVKSNTADTITVYGSWLGTDYNTCGSAPGAGTTFDVKTDGFDLYDNSWIGDWTCTGSFPSGAPSWGSFPTSAQVGAGAIALATTDCYDGTRDLLPTEASRAVRTGNVTATSTNIITTNLTLNVNEFVGQKVLITGGTGANGYGRIESNTGGANATITVDSWTSGEPSTDSTFSIIYLIPHATYNPNTDVDGNDDDQLNGNNGPLTQEVLNNWKGTRLPTASDFFGFCGYNSTDGSGDGSYENTTGTYTADKTFGNYGGQVGRTDEFLDLGNSGSWEWLSEQHSRTSARVAGTNACSYFVSSSVYYGNRFRAVFRP